ncbi:RDD family protein [Streptomyces sp. TS71-3]|uniref:RDD family protein n=1 Tax=Streptomyces sp. TS71-3 TaxID=2733862 RepID=UPI001B2E2503|nr:RDD family protein [Streptomyces sp. TS71-3]GHJ36534.1 hypothetical protein Sm713_21430 [Streptomyces sp. TS71-3]
MSAPTPAPGDDRPREGYYPDPSIPGYVRYWNGAAWVPGTSRPAPAAGETLPRPPGAGPAPASVEETGPVFFDEEPPPSAIPQQASGDQEYPGIPEQSGGPEHPEPAAAQYQGIPEQTGPGAQGWEEGPGGPGRPGAEDASGPAGEPGGAPVEGTSGGPGGVHGSRPEPASAWQADASRQSGFGGEQDRRVSWGAAGAADPRVPHSGEPAQGGTAGAGGPHGETGGGGRPDGTMQIRSAQQGSPGAGQGANEQDRDRAGGPEGTVTFRRPGDGRDPASGDRPAPPRGPAETGTVAIRAVRPGPDSAPPAGTQQPGRHGPGGPGMQGPGRFGGPQGPQTTGTSGPTVAGVPAMSGTVPYLPHQPGAGPSEPWPGAAQQPPAGSGDEPVVPWKPPTSDPFLEAAQAQASARPAALGKRFAARLIDMIVISAATAVAAVPLGTKAVDHIQDKINAARLSGETVTVWLLDGTTGMSLGIILAVLLLFGVLYEAVPTAKWGRTLGKKLCGLQVRDIEAHGPPTFGAALRRWLVYSVPGLLVIGVLGVLWCLFDRPWRQCWHDKAAHTFVSA